MMPVIAWNALHSSRILARVDDGARIKCVEGMPPTPSRARELLDRSTARRAPR
jgi:fumarate hydratase class II